MPAPLDATPKSALPDATPVPAPAPTSDAAPTPAPRCTLPKRERLCGRKAIEALIQNGRSGEVPGILRYRLLCGTGTGLNRIMISVPKRSFKRAVRRNLLKRRIRESYRLQKHGLATAGNDFLITYVSKEILPYRDIFAAVGKVISKINGRTARQKSDAPASDPHKTETDGQQ